MKLTKIIPSARGDFNRILIVFSDYLLDLMDFSSRLRKEFNEFEGLKEMICIHFNYDNFNHYLGFFNMEDFE